MKILLSVHDEAVPDTFREFAERSVHEVLSPYEKRLTRVEIHLRDMNGKKGGIDKRCVIEARPKGLDPVAAEHDSTKVADAFQGALEKLRRVLERRFGRMAARDSR